MNSSVFTPLALAATSLILYLLALFQPLMSLDIYGRIRTVSLFSGPIELIHEGRAAVGLLVLLTTVVFPAMVISLMLVISVSIARGEASATIMRCRRWYEQLRPWSMAEVYILGVFVAYSKLIDLARVELGYGVYAIAGLMITMASAHAAIRPALTRQRRRMVGNTADGRAGSAVTTGMGGTDGALPPAWKMVACSACGLVCTATDPLALEAAVGSCPRCGQTLRRRKPDSLRRTLALLTAAVVFYIPANLLPIMTIIKLYRGGGHTIIGGVIELYEGGMLPLALLVFFASITVPVLKILSLGAMMAGTWRRSKVLLVDRSKLYWIITFIGRWSMIDVFMVSILVGLVQFGALGHVTADGGIQAFAAVVVLTIFATEAFDPRLMWDAAGLNRVQPPPQQPRMACGPVSHQEAATA